MSVTSTNSSGGDNTGSGRRPQQQTDITIIRDLMARITALEQAVNRSQGVTFVSPDGNTYMTLSIADGGDAVWTNSTQT